MQLRGNRNLSEQAAAAAFAPQETFSLNCFFAQAIIDIFLAGVLTMQLYTYVFHQSHRRDSIYTQAIVVCTALVACAVSALIAWWTSYLMVHNFGTYLAFYEIDKSTWFPLLDAVAAALAQMLFGYRAYVLANRNRLLALVLALLITTCIVSTVTLKILSDGIDSQADGRILKVPQGLWLSASAATDTIITATIAIALTRLRKRAPFGSTSALVARLVRMTFETQLPPTLLALGFLIQFFTHPQSYIGVLLQGVLSKVYAVGVLYTLNARINFLPTSVTTLADEARQDTRVVVSVIVDPTTYDGGSSGRQDVEAAPQDLSDKSVESQSVEMKRPVHEPGETLFGRSSRATMSYTAPSADDPTTA